ncbi:hypothetical protein LX32DRAFT_49824 [Colletotrichum zoysiae]|uniref:Uncharacterized protein n=1 Tax=Colletotrichum zoysiae TaxID=1216348 RepID=A0AAD9HB68_9PEZI|nr:hypothetical protein LX32DRAFT_49824 [Colletotrichum zoysiae]
MGRAPPFHYSRHRRSEIPATTSPKSRSSDRTLHLIKLKRAAGWGGGGDSMEKGHSSFPSTPFRNVPFEKSSRYAHPAPRTNRIACQHVRHQDPRFAHRRGGGLYACPDSVWDVLFGPPCARALECVSSSLLRVVEPYWGASSPRWAVTRRYGTAGV